MNIPEECKHCERDCQILTAPMLQTAAYYPPIINKQGININIDGNVTFGGCKCLTCNKQWTFEEQYGKVVWTRIYEN